MPVTNSEANVAKCVCGNCPSYNACMGGQSEKLYCAMGKTACELEHKGCVCGDCPVEQENKLESGFYCGHGAA
ncbi:MAG: DUF2769 domain-containing protein [Patescibacteria group bacterium]|nr:DUF2769 domain-containing protein [Patescibacteria group bacterium]